MTTALIEVSRKTELLNKRPIGKVFHTDTVRPVSFLTEVPFWEMGPVTRRSER